MQNNDEVWLDVNGYENLYLISNYGRVFSLLSNKFLKLQKDYSGYFKAKLTKNKQDKIYPVHTLSAAAFIGKRPDKHVINHINGNKEDNNSSNLEYTSYSENSLHSYHVLDKGKKLTPSQVLEVIKLRKTGTKIKTISEILGISKPNIKGIISGRTWSTITGIKYKKKRARLSKEIINKIDSLIKLNWRLKHISDELNMPLSTVSGVKHRLSNTGTDITNVPSIPKIDQTEEFKDVPRYLNKYMISNFGRIYSVYSNRFLKPMVKGGYYLVGLTSGSKTKYYRIHRLVAESFLNKPDNDTMMVNHKDGDRFNNRVLNLEYVTRSGNMVHACNSGKISKVKKDQVIQIFKLCKLNQYTQQEIASMFNTTKAVVSGISTGKTWSYITGLSKTV